MGKTSFLCRSSRAITCGFSLVHVQLFIDRTSAHSREGFRALRSHYEDRQLTASEGPLCALLAIEQCYNAVTVRLRCPESAGGSYDPITTRWPIPLQNTHAYDPWTQLEFRALICVIRKKSRWAPTSTRGAGVDSLGARFGVCPRDTIDVCQSTSPIAAALLEHTAADTKRRAPVLKQPTFD
jgi:hypothetical protein